MACGGYKSGYAQMSKNEGKNGFSFDVTLICKQVVILWALLPCLQLCGGLVSG